MLPPNTEMLRGHRQMWMKVFTYLKKTQTEGKKKKMWISLCYCRHGRIEYEYIWGAQLPTSFLWGAQKKIHHNYQQRLMSGWHSYNQHMTLKIPTHPFPVFPCIWASLCVGLCVCVCVRVYMCVCLYLWNTLCPVIPWELAGHLPLPLITADSS